MRYRVSQTIPALRRAITGDSIERAQLLARLVKLVREDERKQTLDRQAAARAQTDRERAARRDRDG